MNNDLQNEIDALKLIAGGSIIAEYGCRMMQDRTKQDLKQRVNFALNANIKVQNWFKFHQQSNTKLATVFTQQFNDNRFLFIGQIVKELFGFVEEDLEEILTKLQMVNLPINPTTTSAPTLDEGLE